MTISTENVWTLLREDLGRFFRRRVKDVHRAEDLVQETFVRVHDRLEDLSSRERLGPWVFRIARNVWIDQARRADASTTHELEDVAEEFEDVNFNEDVSGWARSMIELLPPEDRAALELSELQGRAQKEVAERLGLSLSGAKSRIQRGRSKLRAMLLACCHLEFDGHGNVIGYQARQRCQCCESR